MNSPLESARVWGNPEPALYICQDWFMRMYLLKKYTFIAGSLPISFHKESNHSSRENRSPPAFTDTGAEWGHQSRVTCFYWCQSLRSIKNTSPELKLHVPTLIKAQPQLWDLKVSLQQWEGSRKDCAILAQVFHLPSCFLSLRKTQLVWPCYSPFFAKIQLLFALLYGRHLPTQMLLVLPPFYGKQSQSWSLRAKWKVPSRASRNRL